MKNKIFILTLLVLFVSVFFISCGDNAKSVKEVTVTAMAGDFDGGVGSYLVQWEARGKHVDSFDIYIKQKDKSSVIEVTWNAMISNKWSYPTNLSNDWPKNTDFDKWNAVVMGYKDVQTNGATWDVYIGVRAISAMGISDHSNITWSKDTVKINVDSSGNLYD